MFIKPSTSAHLDDHLSVQNNQALLEDSTDSSSIRNFSQGDPSNKLDPWYVTGLFDGEGNFSITQMGDHSDSQLK